MILKEEAEEGKFFLTKEYQLTKERTELKYYNFAFNSKIINIGKDH